MLLVLARAHSGVAVHFGVGTKSGVLFFAGVFDAVPNCGRILFGVSTRDIAVFGGGEFDMKIDPVEKRAGEALAVTLDWCGPQRPSRFKSPKYPHGMVAWPTSMNPAWET